MVIEPANDDDGVVVANGDGRIGDDLVVGGSVRLLDAGCIARTVEQVRGERQHGCVEGEVWALALVAAGLTRAGSQVERRCQGGCGCDGGGGGGAFGGGDGEFDR